MQLTLPGRFSQTLKEKLLRLRYGYVESYTISSFANVFCQPLQDTAGSERYEAMSRMYYRNARAAIVCYDLSDSSSFDRVKFWVSELKEAEEV